MEGGRRKVNDVVFKNVLFPLCPDSKDCLPWWGVDAFDNELYGIVLHWGPCSSHTLSLGLWRVPSLVKIDPLMIISLLEPRLFPAVCGQTVTFSLFVLLCALCSAFILFSSYVFRYAATRK